jgi:LCP family protein required for cell wall assembly
LALRGFANLPDYARCATISPSKEAIMRRKSRRWGAQSRTARRIDVAQRTDGVRNARDRRQRRPDRLTAVLIGVAVLLCVAITMVSASIWAGDRGDQAESAVTSSPVSGTAEAALLPAPSPVPATPPPCVPPNDWITYAVQEGDTLYTLAQRYSTEVEALKQVNCLQSDLIQIGRELYVPGPPVVRLPASGTFVPAANVQEASQAGTDGSRQYVHIILLGSDKRENKTTWRTDTMIVVSIDLQRNLVRLLSIPRDLWVHIPGHGYDRINTADLWGDLANPGSGTDVVKQTVYENLGIPIDYYVRADFDGFVKIVDAFGGVDVMVECRLTDVDGGIEDLDLQPGMQHLDGEHALYFVRSRKTTSDFDRIRRQRKVLLALWDKGKSMDIVPRLPALWLAMSDTFKTDMPLSELVSLAPMGMQLEPDRIFSESIGPNEVQNWVTPDGFQVLLPLPDEIQKLLSSFYGPIDLELLNKKSKTKVEVLNGSSRAQAELLAASSLRWAGFKIANKGLADRQDYAATQVIVYNADTKVVESALKALSVPSEALQYQPDASSTIAMRIILGADYDPCAAK